MCKVCKPLPKDESWDWDMEQDAREYLNSLAREEQETDDGE